MGWRYEPAEDETVDPQWVSVTHPNIAIQDCRSYGGGFAVVEYSGEGESFAVTHHPQEHRSLAAAQRAARALMR